MPKAIQLLLTVLAGLARGRNQEDVADYLELVAELVIRGDAVREELEALTLEIRALAESGQDPTAEQREAVRTRRQQLSEELRSLGDATTTSTT